MSSTVGDALRRVPDALDELVALVESARAMPLSSSCVLPREEALDLLDELREALPQALEDAREVMAAREELLGQARDRRDRITTDAREEADRVLTAARDEADRLLADGCAGRPRQRRAGSCRRPRTGRAGCGPTPTRTPTSAWRSSRTPWPACSARSSAVAICSPAATSAPRTRGSSRRLGRAHRRG